MKVISYTILHYGSDYLDASIKAIEPCVDKIVIFYSEKPTFGNLTNADNPDKKETLYKIATEASEKVMWIEVSGIHQENQHRALIEEMADGYDLILAVDSDEVWDTESLKKALHEASNKDNQRIMIDGFVHFWKSFNHVCKDHWLPVRITNRRSHNRDTQGTVNGTVYHFGYAQREEILRYKWAGIHGHQSELRPNWIEEIYFGWNENMKNVHPTSHGVWNPQPFDKTQLPELLKNHPNYNKEVI